MSVVGTAAVESAAASNSARLSVGPTDLVTPLAREKARDLGIEIVLAEAGAGSRRGAGTTHTGAAIGTMRIGGPVGIRTSGQTVTEPPRRAGASPQFSGIPGREEEAPEPIRPPSGALFRRGSPLAPAVRPDRLRSTTSASDSSTGTHSAGAHSVGRVVVAGAGNVGMIAAMRLAETDLIDEVVLVDIAGSRAAGIALDITHAAPLLGFSTRVRGATSMAEAGPADYVVITAGRARTPGMSRSDLVETNSAIVGGLARDAVAESPDAVLLIVTNPLDEMTQHAQAVTGLPTDRVIGMAGVLDSSRFVALTGLSARSDPRNVKALALGSHGDEMVLPLSQASIDGRPLSDVLDPGTVDGLVDRARNSGGEVVGLLETGSAFLTPGLSAAHMVEEMIRGTGNVLAATVAPNGRYGIESGYVGLPVRLGRRGLAEVVELPLSEGELRDLRRAAESIRQRVGELEAAS